MISYGQQSIDDSDVEAVVAALRSNWLTQGPRVPQFERAIGAYCQVPYAYAVANGTAALHVACLALDVGPDSRVWTVPNTFVASANCARYCGASIDFVDIDPRTACLSVPALADKLARSAAAGTLPQVVVAVDFAGQPCDWAGLRQLADQYGFALIQDAAHALGARYRGEPVGNCRHADITIFSFHPVKVLTTGEGGMLTTQRPELAERIQLLRNHGITRDRNHYEFPAEGPWAYEQQLLGFNYRLSDIHAALGLSQLQRLEQFLQVRRQLAARYDAILADWPLQRPWVHPDGVSAWHLYTIQLGDAGQRRQVFDDLKAAGVGCQVHYQPVHLQPYYRRLGFAPGHCPVAEHYAARTLTLPLHPGIDDDQFAHILRALGRALGLGDIAFAG